MYNVLHLVAQSCPTLGDPRDYMFLARPLCPWDSPGKNTGADCDFLQKGKVGKNFNAVVGGLGTSRLLLFIEHP